MFYPGGERTFREVRKNYEVDSVDTPMELHPHSIEKEGKKEFVVLPYEEFLVLEETMNDYEDLRVFKGRKRKVDKSTWCSVG